MKHLRIRNSAGDTIIEVLIVLAILGLAFAISYATANHGLIQSRNAEEHSESLGIVDSQVELLRSAFSQQVTVPQDGTAFCMQGTTPISFAAGYVPPTSGASDDFSKYPNACNQNTLYYESIVYDTANNDFDLRIRWDGLGNLGRQQEEISYKISPLSITGLTWSNNAPPIIPVLAATGGTGPLGAFYPTDTVHITVTGVNPGDPCVIKSTSGTTYLSVTAISNSCVGTFPASNLPANSITNLKASVTDNSTVYLSNTVAVKTITSSITPVLAATCSGTYSGTCSGGKYQPGDTVNITVTGVNPGDRCVINSAGGTTYLSVTAASNKCTGSFSSDNLPPDSTTNLTASVTDNGTVYTSNTVSVKTVTPTCPFGFHQSTAASYQNYIWYSGDYSDPPYCVSLSF